MRKRLVFRGVIALSLISVLLVGRPDAGFAHAQLTDASSTSHTTRPAAAALNSYANIFRLQNRITNLCLWDNAYAGVFAGYCADLPDDTWGFTLDYYDGFGNAVGTLQNQVTGSCLDDSAEYGLRGYYCHRVGDPRRVHQQFGLTWSPAGYVLQNMATGSCVDDSKAYGLRGYYCNGTYFQDWWPL